MAAAVGCRGHACTMSSACPFPTPWGLHPGTAASRGRSARHAPGPCRAVLHSGLPPAAQEGLRALPGGPGFRRPPAGPSLAASPSPDAAFISLPWTAFPLVSSPCGPPAPWPPGRGHPLSSASPRSLSGSSSLTETPPHLQVKNGPRRAPHSCPDASVPSASRGAPGAGSDLPPSTRTARCRLPLRDARENPRTVCFQRKATYSHSSPRLPAERGHLFYCRVFTTCFELRWFYTYFFPHSTELRRQQV